MKQKTKEKLKRLNKPVMIISLIINALFILILILGSVFNNTKSNIKVNASEVLEEEETRLTDLTNTSWHFNEVLNINTNENEVIFNLMTYIESTDTVGPIFAFVYNGDALSVNGFLIYYPDEYYPQNWRSEDDRDIYITGGSDSTNTYLINWFYENATLDLTTKYTFTFSKNFNYNAPYSIGGDSVFCLGTPGFKTYQFDSWFISNGEVFDTIRLIYISGNGSAYRESGQVRVNDNPNTISYNYMEYLNSATGHSRFVNGRNYETYYNTGSSSTNVCLVNGSTWRNSNYQTLYFLGSLSPSESTNLNQFNNYDVFSSLVGGDSTVDIGLANVFTLLGSAFGSFSSIFAIQLLPGITIGLLFFMPLIVGIILFIIWLIKR